MHQLRPRRGGRHGSRCLARQTGSVIRWLSAIGCAVVLTACGGGSGSSEVVPPPAVVQTPTITAQPQPAEVTAGHIATFKVQAQGTGPLSYQWLRGGLPIEGATAAEYSLRALNADSGAAFAVKVTNTAGSTLSQTAELTTKAPVLPDATITVQRAVEKADFVRADTVLQRVPGAEWDFIATSGNWVPRQAFLFEGAAYKVESIRKADNGSQVLHTVGAEAGDIFSDLKFEIHSPMLAYDTGGRPLRSTQLRQHRMTRLASRSPDGKRTLELSDCFKTPGEVEIPIGDDKTNTYGYELSFDCSLDEFLGATTEDSGLRLRGSAVQSGESRLFYDSGEQTHYQEQNVTGVLNITVANALVLDATSLANLKAACARLRDSSKKNFCDISGRDGRTTIKLARSFYEPKPRVFLINGVPIPYYLVGGFTFALEISATGEVGGNVEFSKFVRAGHIRGVKVLDEPMPTVTFNPIVQFTGEADAFLGLFGAVGVGDTKFLSAINVTVEGGGYVNGKVDKIPPCIAVEVGGRIGLTVNVGRSRWWDGWDVVDQKLNFPLDPWVKPHGCTTAPGMTKLSYVVAGKNKYTYSFDESTDTTDVYQAMHSLVARTDPAVPKLIRVDLAGTAPPRGKVLALDYELVDSASGSSVSLQGDINIDKAANAYLTIDPGGTSYGDSITVRISAYVPGDRAATEVTRIVRLQIEPKLEAHPVYRKQVDTDGAETHLTDFSFAGPAYSKGAISITAMAIPAPWNVTKAGLGRPVRHGRPTRVHGLVAPIVAPRLSCVCPPSWFCSRRPPRTERARSSPSACLMRPLLSAWN